MGDKGLESVINDGNRPKLEAKQDVKLMKLPFTKGRRNIPSSYCSMARFGLGLIIWVHGLG